MRYLPLIAGVLLICAPAKADKFWLSDPKAAQNAPAGSSPNFIEGVLIDENREEYHVRVSGGELVLRKTSVFKVEKDDLSLEAIVKAEIDSKQAGKLANQQRNQHQALASEIREVKTALAAARRSARTVEASSTRPEARRAAQGTRFDPIVGTTNGFDDNYILMRDAEIAWSLTKDRRYLRIIRKLRRLR